ncbi:family 43 glycosylhydrolase [Lactobacillus amylovorus]|uniref:Family 43 glycosylhydrolase n=1 Tax=Lactobacillus amylovorus TaxID=1604 RepID=A0A9X3W707_LACAM|nr:family 43 glycosylhydrolase [Lactobacillus amylovorus]MDB6255125.1 family 43 glycosylhydrolase [Lactobacillus amylovorus]MDB6259042.1 family 43 glycosylhydrolase [Lactobacillus amylovorus]
MNTPLVEKRADPWVYLHTDGYYYFCGSVPGYQVIELRRARKLTDLKNAEIVNVWHAHKTGPMSKLIWAPELHYWKGKWYIYFAASDDESIRDDKHHHNIFVLEGEGDNPLTAKWTEKGKVKTHQDSFSLDATVFEHNGDLYMCWAQLEPAIHNNSNLFLARMKNPWTIEGKELLLSVPEYSWEQVGFKVNEGPAEISHEDKVIITYSASATDENYVMGLLWANKDADLLDGYSWHKSPTPVFKSSNGNKLWGPGHNSFTKVNGKDVLVYHARPYTQIDGDPLDNPDRHAYAKYFSWNEKGLPEFGKPGDENQIQ